MSFLDTLKNFFKSDNGNSSTCKAYSNGKCMDQRTGQSTGQCSWNPKNWKNCGVVIENTRFYGKW